MTAKKIKKIVLTVKTTYEDGSTHKETTTYSASNARKAKEIKEKIAQLKAQNEKALE